jgi:hypothetical protein|tara:strand:- start:48893 stop:49324 length:432 start_codon:yes stop_codon:yes gene_type:complete
MDIFTGQGHKSGTLIRVIKVIVLYLILINSSNYSARKNHNLNSNCNQLPQENMNIHCSLINNLDEKVLLDLSKNDLLSLLNKDSIISISIDLEGKIIGYRPSTSRIPSYWSAEVIKKVLTKNNLFSLSFKNNQIVSFKLSCLS